MFSTHRHARCQALLNALPHHDSLAPGKTMRELLALLVSHYQDCASEKAQIRAIQHDLKALRDAEEIICDPTRSERTTLRYRRAPQDAAPTRNVDINHLYEDLIDRGISPALARDFVQRLQGPRASYYDLPPEQFVAVSDSVRLLPKNPPDATVQSEILQALQQGRVLKAAYRKPGSAQAEERFLHPLGVLLRGPQHYLIAYDDKELGQTPPQEKMFLIQRMEDVAVLPDRPSQLPPGASLPPLVRDQGLADFVHQPRLVTLKLRVWGYVIDLLEHNQIAPDQTFRRAANGKSATVTAKLLPSGTLYRWLLGFGDKVKVLQPDSLRRAIAWQAYNTTGHYEAIYDEEGEDGEDEA